METLLSDLISRLTDLQPQLVDPSQLDEAQAKAESDLEETQALLDEAKAALQTTRDKNVQSQTKATRDYEETAFTKNKEAEDLTARCSALQDELNGINSEISVARQLSEQLAASIASLQKSV